MDLNIGRKLLATQATTFTDEIKRRMYARWNEQFFGGAYRRDLEARQIAVRNHSSVLVRRFANTAVSCESFGSAEKITALVQRTAKILSEEMSRRSAGTTSQLALD